LLEIVTEPDMRSSDEAVAYAKELHKIVTWIGICDGNMQEGSFRCDANVSVRKPGAELGTRREIKNLNSFKFMQQAIDYEVRWQIEQIEDGHAIQQAVNAQLLSVELGQREPGDLHSIFLIYEVTPLVQ
jgi:aspartyl-tRNA(Asn)/glutamyl-tRNA(Gln) amidotransferase subunit B